MSSQTEKHPDTFRRLHGLHQLLEELRGRMMKGPRLAQAYARQVQEAAQALEDARKVHQDLKMAGHRKQMDYDQKLADIQRRKSQLLQAKDNREYQVLKDQIAADEMASSVLADEVLELMDRAEAAARNVAECEEKVAAAKRQADQWTEEFARQEPTIRAEIERVEAELRHVESQLSGDIREMYQRAVRTKGSSALAPVRGEFCGGCNQHVPLNMRSQLKLGEQVWCRSCGRLLFFEEDE
ncbi:zinc ribbon domain-containing protein [Thermopirellula anaerolimosa]